MAKLGNDRKAGADSGQDHAEARGSGGRCPTCKKPTIIKWRPFCSRRCADVDLGKWLTGGFVIRGNSSDDEEDGLPNVADFVAPESE